MKYLLTLGLCSAIAACGHTPPPPGRFDASGADLKADNYPHVYASWTRDNRLYEGLENKVFLSASFLTTEMRTAIRTTYPDVIGHGTVVTRTEITSPTAEPNTFFLSVYTADRRWNELDRAKSIWRLSLITDNGTVDASDVVHVAPDANLREIFPIVGRYDECYLVRFPQMAGDKALIGPETTQVKLRMAAAMGETVLSFDIVRGNAPVPTSGDPPFPPAIR